MKVLLLGPANIVHTQRWVEALVERGLEVITVTQHEPSGWTPPNGAELLLLPIRNATGYFANVFAFKHIVAMVRPDVVNVHYASGYGTLAGLADFTPNVLSVWGSDVYDFPYQSWLAGRLIRRNLRRATRIASTSTVMARQVRSLVPDIGDIAITPFGVDTAVFKPTVGDRDRNSCTIGTVKTLADKYGVDVLIRAFSRLVDDPEIRASGIPLRLQIVGDGPKRSALESLSNELGIQEDVAFVGAVPHADVPLWLNQLDIFVAPSRLDSESFGVAVIEASSCGLPVVVSEAGGLPEVVVANTTGLIVPKEDDASLARAIKQLILDADLRRQMGDAGRDFVRREYEWRHCVDLMIGCYETAIL